MLGEFLSGVKEWIAFLWPFAKLSQWQRGVRETYVPAYWRIRRKGKWLLSIERVEARVVVKELGPGMHRKVPWVDELHDHSVVEDPFKVDIQNVTTKDGVSVTAKVVVISEVFNVMKATLEVHNYETAIKDVTEIHVNRAIRSREWKSLIDEQDKLETEIKEAIHDRTKKWGVRIKEVGFSTFVQSEQINRFNVNQ